MAGLLPDYDNIPNLPGTLDKNAWALWQDTGKQIKQLGGKIAYLVLVPPGLY